MEAVEQAKLIDSDKVILEMQPISSTKKKIKASRNNHKSIKQANNMYIAPKSTNESRVHYSPSP